MIEMARRTRWVDNTPNANTKQDNDNQHEAYTIQLYRAQPEPRILIRKLS